MAVIDASTFHDSLDAHELNLIAQTWTSTLRARGYAENLDTFDASPGASTPVSPPTERQQQYSPQPQTRLQSWAVVLVGDTWHWPCQLCVTPDEPRSAVLLERGPHGATRQLMPLAQLHEIKWDSRGTGLFRLIFGAGPSHVTWTLFIGASATAFPEILDALR